MLFGLGLDYIFSASDINPQSLVHMGEEAGAVAIVSSIALWSFVLYFLAKQYLKK